MKRRPIITTSRAVEVYKEALDCRRRYCSDDHFFRVSELWEHLCAESEDWSIKLHRSDDVADYKRKAGVIEFDGRVTLIADERLMDNARRGCGFSNFILAHELAHLMLDHHAKGAVIKNFQLFSSDRGMSNTPPTNEELEANIAAVFLQCGVALSVADQDPVKLARRAFTDVTYVKKALRFVQLEVFQEEFKRQSVRRKRIVL